MDEHEAAFQREKAEFAAAHPDAAVGVGRTVPDEFPGVHANAVAPTFEAEVRNELARARGKFGPIRNLHEGYAVILEELDELWEEVRGKDDDQSTRAWPHSTRLTRAYRELVQIAAMCQRTAEDLMGS